MSRYTFSSESVSEGHPDKVCDYISDSILDACFEQDKHSRVACETLCKSDTVVIAGEITTDAKLDYDRIVRQAVKEIGYTDTRENVAAAQKELAASGAHLDVVFAGSWFDHPLFVAANAAHVQAAQRRLPIEVRAS